MELEGGYDWARRILELPRPGAGAAQRGGRPAPLAEYVRPGLRVARCPRKGLAVTAGEALPAGALLLVETAFAAGPTIGEALEDACARLDPRSARAAPRRLRAQVCALAGDHGGALGSRAGVEQGQARSGCPLEAWGDDLPEAARSPEELGHVLQRNAMATLGLVDKPDGYSSVETLPGMSEVALYPLGSLWNHDCSPNCTRLPLGSSLVARAGRDIAAGEELTWTYLDVRRPFSVRASELRSKWGFECACARCAYEASLPPRIQEGLARTHEAFERFKATGQASEDELRSQVRAARRCVERAGSSLGPTASATAERRGWLLASAFVLLAFELAVGLRCSGRHEEAAALLGEVEDVYGAVVPSSAMHATALHVQSVVHFEGSALARPEAMGVLRRAVLVHSRCFGGGSRVYRLLARRGLPQELQGLLPSLEPEARTALPPSALAPLPRAAALAVAEPPSLEQPKAAATAAAAAPEEAPRELLGVPAFQRLPGGGLLADLPLPGAPAEGAVQLSACDLRVGPDCWRLPWPVDPEGARVRWLRRLGVLRVEAAGAAGGLAAEAGHALGALD